MARAGKEGTPVFLVGGKPEVLAQTEANCGRSGTSILWVARTVTLRRSSVRRYFRVSMPAARKLSPSRWDRQNRNCSCAIVGKCIPMRYIWGWAVPMMCLPVTSNAPQNMAEHGAGVVVSSAFSTEAYYPPDASAALPSLALYWRSLILPSDDLSSGLCLWRCSFTTQSMISYTISAFFNAPFAICPNLRKYSQQSMYP